MAISSDERAFFVAMGERISALRKARNLTQTQLAETLGITQQTVQAYEAGSRRRRGPVPQWEQHIEAVARLPRAKQQFVAQMIETVLAQAAGR
jgi:transcriptional regulator with XRE-family HTH domain